MEKEYSLDEAIEMLRENFNLRFVRDDDIDGEYFLKVTEKGLLYSENERKEQFGIRVTDKWKLVQQPVSFIEAANSGKQIRYEEWSTLYDSLGGVISILNVKSEEEQRKMMRGKWYIKED